MEVVVVGLSLGCSTLSDFEAIRGQAFLEQAEGRLRTVSGVREVVRVVTCRRVEFFLGHSRPGGEEDRGSERRPPSLLQEARRAFLGSPPGAASADEVLHASWGEDAFRHLIRVAAGLDSPLRGEAQVLGQLRSCFAAAVEQGTTGPILNTVFHRAFRAARRIRARAGLDEALPSWGEFLTEVIAAGSDLPAGALLILLGSGSLARSLSVHLRARGFRVEGVIPATLAPKLRSGGVLVTVSGRGRIVGGDELGLEPSANEEVNAVVGGPPGVGGRKTDAPVRLDIWDLGMPRNVDPSVALHPGVRIRTLAHLDQTLSGASAPLEGAIRLAEKLVEAEVEDYRGWRREREMTPSLVRLGRLLELLGPADEVPENPVGESAGRSEEERLPWKAGLRSFRRRLLRGLAAVANDAPDLEETASRLALFEEALRRSASLVGFEGSHETGYRAAASVLGWGESGAFGAGGADLALPGGRLPGGVVSLVGAGPGDPELLTLKGARRLREAEVIYYDALVPSAVLALCRPGARRVRVGKRRGSFALSQDQIEAALVRDARAGLVVVRLKGGDPFVFGRGGEEALKLSTNGIPFEIVPGVSSGTAVPALAGIPLTHRGISSSAAFATAHDLSPGVTGRAVRERLHHLARGADTLVLFMAGAELERVGVTLLDAGLSADTPVALIENGTLPEGTVSKAVLRDLRCLGRRPAAGPVLLIIGRTVSLSEALIAGGVRFPETVPIAPGAKLRKPTGQFDRRGG